MLNSFRRRSTTIATQLILLTVIAVMTMWGVGQMSDESGGADGVAAYVNGEVISTREYAQEYEYRLEQYTQMLGGQMDERFLKALNIPQRTLDEMVQYRLMAQQARRIGIAVPDKELADYIRTLPYLQKDGKFDAALYAKIPNRGVQERQQRERLRVQRFQGYLSERIRLTPEELKRNFELKETKADLYFARINFEKLGASQPVTPAEVSAYLKETSADSLKTEYDNRASSFTAPAQVELKQIRVGIPFQASAEKKEAAKKKIEEIAKEVTPENFAAVAKAKSDDEYAKKGGTVGWINRGTLEAPLEKAIDSLEVGKVSAPVEASFGYFLLMPTAKKDRAVKPLEEVKQELAQTVVKERKAKSFGETLKASWTKMVTEGKPLDAELKKHKIDLKKTGSFALGSGFVPQIGQSDEIMDAVFQLTKDKPVAKGLFPVQEDFVYVKLNTLEQPKAAEFDKQMAALENTTVTALQSEFFNQWVAQLQKSANVKVELKKAAPEQQEATGDTAEL